MLMGHGCFLRNYFYYYFWQTVSPPLKGDLEGLYKPGAIIGLYPVDLERTFVFGELG